MPPEPLPFDRKDFFKDRRHERSSEALGSVARWRDSRHSPWGSSDFRRPTGHGKQGGWHSSYAEEPGHGITPPRSGEKIPEDEIFRPTGSRGDWKYSRNSRDNTRGSFTQKEWKTSSWETSNSGAPKQLDVNNQRSVDDTLTYSPRPHSDFINTWDQNDKMGTVNTLVAGHRSDRENSMGSMDWKPLKWTRSGSLSSRGSGLSHSSSSKSNGGDFGEAKGELQQRMGTPIQSPSGDAVACVTSAAPSDDACSKKKQRLGWGEGLAKYEKKKVGPEDIVVRSVVVYGEGHSDPTQSHISNLSDKSPKIAGFSDCASPTTPSSVACSSSPGMEEKSLTKAPNAISESGNLSSPPAHGSQNLPEDQSFNLENLELNTLVDLTSSLIERLHSNDPSTLDSGFIRATTMKLLLFKDAISKQLEMTESEIDLLENESKSLTSESALRCSQLETKVEEAHTEVKDDDIDSPGSATSKFVEPQFSRDSDMTTTKALVPSDASSVPDNDNTLLYESIVTSNKKTAESASEVFNKLLLKNQCQFDLSSADFDSSLKNDSFVKEKFLRRKRFMRLKEGALTLKYRVLQNSWKEDMRSLSIGKYRAKSHKRSDLTLRTSNNPYQKHRSSIRSRSSSQGNLNLVPSAELVNFTNKLLSESQLKMCRSTLKMPALILDRREKSISRFISNNGLVEDPDAVEKERSMINPWTSEEKELFLDNLATFGKDFKKIASFLEHKTAAECIEFYYKNHKEACFEKTKKKMEFRKQGKTLSSNTYLVTSGKKWNREMNSASLELLGAVSAIAAAQADDSMNCKTSRADGVGTERSSSFYVQGNERDTAAAEMLAGFCGTHSSEAISSCITTSADPSEGGYLKMSSITGRPFTPEAIRNYEDESCSEESCGEMDSAFYWTDQEKSTFIQALSSYGRDFTMIACCVRTKSKDQCRVFFSKARKCLGLDGLGPAGGGNGGTPLTGDDANGDGSDTEDPCVMETRSDNQSDSKMDEDLPESVSKINHEDESDPGNLKLETDLNTAEEEENGLYQEEVEAMLEDLGPDIYSRDMPDRVCEEEGRRDEDEDTDEKGPLVEESPSVGETVDPVPLTQAPSRIEDKPLVEIYTEEHGKTLVRQELLLPTSGLSDVVTAETGNVGLLADNTISSGPTYAPVTGPTQKHPAISLDPMEGPREKILINHTRPLSTLPLQDLNNQQHLIGHPLLNHVEPTTQVLRGYPLPVASIKTDMNGDISLNGATVQSLKLERSFQTTARPLTQECYLQKCNGSKPETLVSDLSLQTQSLGQTGHHHMRPSSRSLSDTESPCRNGDVKLFGQILSHPAPPQKPNTTHHENDEKTSDHVPKSFNLKFNANHQMEANLTPIKYDRTNYVGLENLPMRSFGFWDGNRIQTGYAALPDSAILLAKYPAALKGYPTTSKLEAAVKGNECNMNGVAVNGLGVVAASGTAAGDYQLYRTREPFTVEMKQRQELLAEMQRRNNFEQQGRGIVGMNMVARGGILGGGGGGGAGCTASVISDPVAAMKLHYAKADPFGTQGDETTLRGNGDLGR